MLAIPLEQILWLVVTLTVAGAVTGFLAGLFGVGGGAIIVPILYQVFTLLNVPDAVRMPLSIGTSLAVIVPTSIAAYRTHRAKGAVDQPIVRQWAVPCFLGVAAGSAIAAFAPAWLFKVIFIATASTNGILLLVGRREWKITDQLPTFWPMRALGFGIGIFSSLMGISGGMLSNITLLLFGRTMQQAVATSAALGVVISIAGTMGYMAAGWPKMALLPPLSVGFVSLLGLALLAPLGMVFAPFGARLAHQISRRRLEIAFGLYLLLVSARFVLNLL